jgi:hypothetical protein
VCSFLRPAVRSTSYRCKKLIGSSKDVRLPWIHMKEAFDFHSVDALLLKNHAAVP